MSDEAYFQVLSGVTFQVNGGIFFRAEGNTVNYSVGGTDVRLGDYILKSTFKNKGDILTYDGTDIQVLPVGTDGQIIVADSAQDIGLKLY